MLEDELLEDGRIEDSLPCLTNNVDDLLRHIQVIRDFRPGRVGKDSLEYGNVMLLGDCLDFVANDIPMR